MPSEAEWVFAAVGIINGCGSTEAESVPRLTALVHSTAGTEIVALINRLFVCEAALVAAPASFGAGCRCLIPVTHLRH